MAPIIPLPPALLSTTTLAPSTVRSFSASRRAMVSTPPPAENGTTMVIGRAGYGSAANAWLASRAAARALARSNARRWTGMVSPGVRSDGVASLLHLSEKKCKLSFMTMEHAPLLGRLRWGDDDLL